MVIPVYDRPSLRLRKKIAEVPSEDFVVVKKKYVEQESQPWPLILKIVLLDGTVGWIDGNDFEGERDA